MNLVPNANPDVLVFPRQVQSNKPFQMQLQWHDGNTQRSTYRLMPRSG